MIELIRASTIEAHGFLGYLDFGDGDGRAFWLPPQSQSLWEYLDREEDGAPFQAPASTIEDGFEFLLAHPRSVPAGTFLFVLSDFLAPPPIETWIRALEHRWDVIPVVLQDPLWERSFPAVDGFVLDVADVEGRSHEVHLTRGESRARTLAHETALGRASRELRARLARARPRRVERRERPPARVPALGRAPPVGGRGVVSRVALTGALAAVGIALLPEASAAAVGIVRMQTTLSPSPVVFGQVLTADLDVVVNTKVADPETFQTRARFFPYVLLRAPRRDDERDGSVVRVRYTYRLACDSLACTTGAKRERKIVFPETLVRYRDLQGHARRVSATWPELRLVSRTSTSQFRPQTATEAERGLPTAPLLELPATSPPRLRRTGSRRPRERSHSSPLRSSLSSPRRGWRCRSSRSRARGRERRRSCRPSSAPSRRSTTPRDTCPGAPSTARHSLSSPASSAGSGRSELVQPARRLAWSEEAPTAGDSRELVTEVRAGRDGR